MTIELSVANAFSRGGVPLNIQAVANIKIPSEEPLLHNALERFLGDLALGADLAGILTRIHNLARGPVDHLEADTIMRTLNLDVTPDHMAGAGSSRRGGQTRGIAAGLGGRRIGHDLGSGRLHPAGHRGAQFLLQLRPDLLAPDSAQHHAWLAGRGNCGAVAGGDQPGASLSLSSAHLRAPCRKIGTRAPGGRGAARRASALRTAG
jgi:hypothetical protein